jgi:hypothetical protein
VARCRGAGRRSVGAVQSGSVLRQHVVLKGRRYVSLTYLAPADALRTPGRSFLQVVEAGRRASRVSMCCRWRHHRHAPDASGVMQMAPAPTIW